jgi:hypothetical protein
MPAKLKPCPWDKATDQRLAFHAWDAADIFLAAEKE